MANSLRDRLEHAWNAFKDAQDYKFSNEDLGASSGRRPDRPRMMMGNERSIVNAVYTRIASDVASVSMVHAKLDQNGRYSSTVNDSLHQCLTVEANTDQTGYAFMIDLAMSLLDEGCVAVVPVETTISPIKTGSYEINSLRTGKITQWYPEHVKVLVYNQLSGRKEEVIVPKNMTAIIENPFYSVMNEPNSTLRRLIYKLGLLDSVDEQSSSGKLDIVVQLPYAIKTEAKKNEANARRKDIEFQLKGSKYGIAYIDAAEKITQLNRPVENNLMKQVEYLTSMLYSQLGISAKVMDGTADEKEMLNYFNRTIDPILRAIRDEFYRKFLTKTARTQSHTILYFRDPFKLVPVAQLAEIADKFTRNEVLTSNEVRSIIGYKPINDPKADELRNKNLNPVDPTGGLPVPPENQVDPGATEADDAWPA